MILFFVYTFLCVLYRFDVECYMFKLGSYMFLYMFYIRLYMFICVCLRNYFGTLWERVCSLCVTCLELFYNLFRTFVHAFGTVSGVSWKLFGFVFGTAWEHGRNCFGANRICLGTCLELFRIVFCTLSELVWDCLGICLQLIRILLGTTSLELGECYVVSVSELVLDLSRTCMEIASKYACKCL